MTTSGDQAPSPLETLSSVAATINSLEDPDHLQERVLESAMQAIGAERGFVILTTPRGLPDLEIQSHRNFRDNELVELERISQTVVTEVIKSGEPLLLYEAQKDERFGSSESIVIEQIQSISCVPLTLKSRRIGAIYLDSVSKPGRFNRESLTLLTAIADQAAVAIENARLYRSVRDENRHLRGEIQRLHGFDEIIGRSRSMRDVFDTLSRVIDSDASVLVQGESGTGKELVARAIHYNGSRKDKPFVAVFCGSLPDELLESELFGHKKGAFTGAVADKKGLFEAAHMGTVFLD
ncbi:MAG: sigma 54-interacting transcriptional regulator, partial [Rhodothermales bacterium]|nr:sigma 54-interacting transcriptional regulator [Rhodothermales bacterium]